MIREVRVRAGADALGELDGFCGKHVLANRLGALTVSEFILFWSAASQCLETQQDRWAIRGLLLQMHFVSSCEHPPKPLMQPDAQEGMPGTSMLTTRVDSNDMAVTAERRILAVELG